VDEWTSGDALTKTGNNSARRIAFSKAPAIWFVCFVERVLAGVMSKESYHTRASRREDAVKRHGSTGQRVECNAGGDVEPGDAVPRELESDAAGSKWVAWMAWMHGMHGMHGCMEMSLYPEQNHRLVTGWRSNL